MRLRLDCHVATFVASRNDKRKIKSGVGVPALLSFRGERSDRGNPAQRKENTMWVYILTNYTNSVLYTGVTNDIMRRTYEHRSKCVDGFAEKYNAYKLVYAEETNSAEEAIAREKQIKSWSRKKKLALIETLNPNWVDLAKE